MLLRNRILQKFEQIESESCVLKWNIYGMDIWPIVKETLFFEALKLPDKLGYAKFLIRSVQDNFRVSLNSNKFDISNKDFLFAGYNANRIVENSYSYNKYFDPMMDYLENNDKKSLLVEFYAKQGVPYYKDGRVLLGGRYLKLVKKTVKINELSNLQMFDEFLIEFCEHFTLNKTLIIKKIKSKINSTLRWESFYLDLLSSTKPKCIFLLCYYCEPCFGLISAAYKLQIPTIDMQHGGQGKLHFAYNYNSKLQNLSLLPSYFWVWDQGSHENLKSWLAEERILLGGNPSLLRKTASVLRSSFKKNTTLILYTLQTTIRPCVPPFLIEAIKKSPSNFQWLFRFHPRMTSEERNEIYDILKKNNILERINFKEANSFSLSDILSGIDVHLSAFSGSLIEADILNVPLNITFHEIGKISHEDLISRGRMVYYDVNEMLDLNILINTSLESFKNRVKNNIEDKRFFRYLERFINKLTN